MADKEETKAEEKRTFLGQNKKVYTIVAPNANDIREADWNYSRTFTRSLTEGITTSAEMMDILRRRGIVGPEFEQRASELARNLNEKIFNLETAEDMNAKRDQAIEVAEARDELFQWNQRLNGPMSNTCEQLADDARLEYLTSCMVVDDKDDRVWDNYDSYLTEKNQALALKSRFEIMLYLQGLESDFLERTPEARAMKEVETDILDKAAQAAKAIEAIVEEEAVKTANKKATRKKRTANKVINEKEVVSE
jgi:hypothetical protein